MATSKPRDGELASFCWQHSTPIVESLFNAAQRKLEEMGYDISSVEPFPRTASPLGNFNESAWRGWIQSIRPGDKEHLDALGRLVKTCRLRLGHDVSQIASKDDHDLQLLEETNSGLYGVVWKARQRSLDRIVAVKIVHPSMADAFDALEHARGLARAGAHPAIVSVYFVTEIPHPKTRKPVQVVVMEWLEGQTLADRLKNPTLTPDATIQIGTSLIDGLEFIHANGLTHSDLHAGNVIITPQGTKIIDIDYAAERSLALLTSGARETRVQADIDAASFLIARMIRNTRIDVAQAAQLEEDARNARSLRGLGTVLQSLTTAPSGISMPAQRTDPTDLVAVVKQSIEDGRNITLRDAIFAETDQLIHRLTDARFSAKEPFTPEEMVARVTQYEEFTIDLVTALAVGCYFGGLVHTSLWVETIERFANPFENIQDHSGLDLWLDLRHYPTTIAMYAASMGALLGGQYRTLAALLRGCNRRSAWLCWRRGELG